MREPLLVLDGELQVIAASRAFYQRFEVAKEESIGRQLSDLADWQWDLPAFREQLLNILPRGAAIEGFAVEANTHGGRRMKRCSTPVASPVHRQLILLTMEEVRSP